MAAWQVSSSSSSSTSDSEPDDVARGRGRGRGRGGRGRGRPRSSIMQLALQEPDVQPLRAQEAATSQDPLATFLRPVGSDLHKEVAAIVAASGPSSRTVAMMPLAQREAAAENMKTIEGLLGGDSTLALMSSPKARALLVGLPYRTLQRHLVVYAATLWYASRALAGSIISRLCNLDPSKHSIVAVYTMRSYDETPMDVRADTPSSTTLPSVTTHVGKRQAAPGKLLQSDMEVVIVSRSACTSQFSVVYLPLACPLKVIQRGTASCLKEGMRSTQEVPLLDSLRQCQPGIFNVDFSASDRAAANSAYEDSVYSEMPRDYCKCKLPCFAHCCHTVQGRAFQTFADDVTGSISAALLLRPADSFDGFRQCVRAELLASLHDVADCPPLPHDHPERQQLESVLRLCLPATGAGKLIADKLRELLTGDTSSEKIVLRVVGGRAALDREWWATETSMYLVGLKIPVYQRHRWCNSLETWSLFGLLSLHRLLRRAGLRFLDGLVEHRALRSVELVVHSRSAWAISSEEEEEERTTKTTTTSKRHDPNNAIVAAPNPTQAWAEFNSQQKKKALVWFRSDPTDRVILLRISAKLACAALHVVERIASEAWQVRVWRECMDTGRYDSRMLRLPSLLSDTLDKLLLRLETDSFANPSASIWQPLHARSATMGMATRAFSMVYSALCGLEQLVLFMTRGPLFQLFRLVSEPSRDLANKLLALAEKQCVVSEFVRRFLQRFNTPSKLRSAECRACLAGAALVLRAEICRIECRHNQSRRATHTAETFGMNIDDLSAYHVLARHRGMDHFLSSTSASSRPRCSGAKTCRTANKGKAAAKKKAKATPGGGAQRAFVSEFLRGKRFGRGQRRALFKAANKSYRKVMFTERHAHYQALGVAGKVSHRQGKKAFGVARQAGSNKRQRTLQQPEEHDPVIAAAELRSLGVLAVARSNYDQEEQESWTRARAQAAIDNSNVLCRASEKALGETQHPVFRGLGSSAGVRHIAMTSDDLDMRIFPVLPPACEIVKRVMLSSRRGGSEDRTSLQKRLKEIWSREHRIIMHQQLPSTKLPAGRKSLARIQLCERLGVCICGTVAHYCRQSLAKMLRSSFAKNKPGRSIYEANRAVVRLYSVCGSRGHHFEQYWFIGFGNLTESVFTVQELVPPSGHPEPLIQGLESSAGAVLVAKEKPKELYFAVRGLPMDRLLHCELCMLDFSAPEMMPLFVPLAVVRVVEPAVSDWFWDGRPRRRNARAQPQASASLDAAAALDAPDLIADGHVHADGEADSGSEAGDADASVLDLPLGADPRDLVWELTSSDEEPELATRWRSDKEEKKNNNKHKETNQQ